MQGTLGPLQRLGTGSNGTLGKLRLGHTGQTLEVIVTGATEVGGTKAEVDSYGTAVATLVLQEVSAMFGTDLYLKYNVMRRNKNTHSLDF